MAALLQNVAGKSKIFSKQVGCSFIMSAVRLIYGSNLLGIDSYLKQREKTSMRFHGKKDLFMTKMAEHMNDEAKTIIFTQDLNHMVHLVDNNEDELKLMTEMIKIYSRQNAELRFSAFTFGPVIMRCLHHFGASELAFKILNDESYGTLFNQISTFIVAMDLLYKTSKYSQAIEIFELYRKRLFREQAFPADMTILYLAACYKMNNLEAFDLMKNLMKEAEEKNVVTLRKGLAFAAGLAINQNHPQLALDFIGKLHNQNYFTIYNLKVIALAKLGQVDQCLEILRWGLDQDLPNSSRNFSARQFCKETLEAVKAAINDTGNKTDLLTIERLEKNMGAENLLTEESLDSSICQQISSKRTSKPELNLNSYESRFFTSSSLKKYKDDSF